MTLSTLLLTVSMIEGSVMSKQLNLFQGCSPVTAVKSKDIYDICKMRLTQNQGKWVVGGLREMFIWDVFCGDGENIVDGEAVLGSPLRILEAIRDTNLAYRVDRLTVLFSDIRDSAVETLDARVEEIGLPPNVIVKIIKKDAESAIPQINQYISDRKNELKLQNKKFKIHSIGIIDPNGPKGIPLDQIRELSESHGDVCDLLVNINVSALKRVLGLSDGKVRGWWAEWIGSFDNFVIELGKNYHSNWVRVNRPGIGGWTVLGFWAYSPPRHWNYNGVNGGYLPYLDARKSWET